MPRRFSYWFVGAIAAWLGYTVVWTQISLGRLYLLRASVFDLGVYAQLGWSTYSTPLSPDKWLATALNFGGTIFLSPTTLGGYPTILAAQSCAIGSGAVLVYLLARHYEHRPPLAFGLSVAYLLYFPLSGINFTDAHYQAYLIPFFLLGVWLYLRGSFVLSFVLFSLAGAIQFPLGVFPLLFGIQLLVPEVSGWIACRMGPTDPGNRSRQSMVSLFRRFARWKFTRSRSPAPKWYIYGLPMTAAALLIGAWLTSGLYATNYTVGRLIHASPASAFIPASSLGVLPNLPVKLWTLFLILAPLAFLPLLSPRWLPFCVPFFALMFYVNYWGYTYPYIATSWYPFLFVPFLFLATVDGVAKIREGSTWVHGLRRRMARPSSSLRLPRKTQRDASETSNSQGKGRVRWQGFRGRPTRSSALAVGAVAVLTIVSASFLTPYGPWNASTDANFSFPVFGQYNQTLYNELVKLASLVPASDSSVLLQNDMPELLPRPTLPGLDSPLVVGPFGTVAYNLTWLAPNGSWSPINPDYVIANPNPSQFGFFYQNGSYPYNISMEQVVTELYATYDYGIVGEANGMLLLKHYYSGPLLYYVPYAAAFPSSTFVSNVTVSGSSMCQSSCLVATDLTDQQTAWYGPYAFLSPGTYSVSIHLGLANWNPDDRALIQVTGDSGGVLLNSTLLSGLTVGPEMKSVYLNTTVFVGGAAPGVEFPAIESNFTGSLAIYGVTVHEVAPPSSVFRAGDTPHDAAVYRLLGLVPSGSTVLAEAALRPYFHNLTLVTVPPNGPIPTAQYELYDPTVPSSCTSGGNSTLCQVVNGNYVSGAFSIVAQSDGVTLLAPSPASLAVYTPLNESISTSQFFSKGGQGQNFTSQSGGNLTVNNQTNGGYAWYGPYANLPPGGYTARLYLSVSNDSPLNHLVLAATIDLGRVPLNVSQLNGSAFPQPGRTVLVSLPFTLSEFTSSLEIVAFGVDWSGIVSLSAVSLVETQAP